ncbi:DUF2244 domain-containing protein [Sedimenticola hydrogenitrophicus]|uniref:DUF2244 domain-containing protein n=1 Tax=Sedimenticola hydrogenitrophicus TaxID=2967975 RepID=UPI0021A5C9E0|nr:DUF2244 domain-containing protein [Sedimenticola hydrogenitrophicus]
MVMHYEMPESRGEVFIVRPNNSLKWRHAKLLFNVIAVVMLGIGLVFWSLGAWLVFPFIVAELVVLACVFYRTSLKVYSREVIAVEPSAIRVIQGGDQPVFQVRPPLARVNLQRGDSRLAAAHLYLQSAESEVEIGECLVESEREALANDLSRAVAACGFRR